ncbi:Hypothetical protein SRAE_0000049000 [Strongyloides ratti]|uniref:Uncharacterized protein n=1 Tax=Strongyloides ratti TaxID=34506 RepID=A0A090L1K9_STRRB|nr:Hypothetical protein SRAE_0000049000 [Strongyloides ratti]CEF61364.1 Hypothetical protein SRAE_0000049000 [Strongyloides ratti]
MNISKKRTLQPTISGLLKESIKQDYENRNFTLMQKNAMKYFEKNDNELNEKHNKVITSLSIDVCLQLPVEIRKKKGFYNDFINHFSTIYKIQSFCLSEKKLKDGVNARIVRKRKKFGKNTENNEINCYQWENMSISDLDIFLSNSSNRKQFLDQLYNKFEKMYNINSEMVKKQFFQIFNFYQKKAEEKTKNSFNELNPFEVLLTSLNISARELDSNEKIYELSVLKKEKKFILNFGFSILLESCDIFEVCQLATLISSVTPVLPPKCLKRVISFFCFSFNCPVENVHGNGRVYNKAVCEEWEKIKNDVIKN